MDTVTKGSVKLPGSGHEVCGCGQHKTRCTFGQAHDWSVYFRNGQLVSTVDTIHCHRCGSVCEPPADATPLTCHSCARPTTEDESVVVRPGERVCIACIKAGKVTNPEPECDLCGYTPCACFEDVR